jgi:hypothetical protein
MVSGNLMFIVESFSGDCAGFQPTHSSCGTGVASLFKGDLEKTPE